MVWEEVRKLIEQETLAAASCDSLRANPDLIERIENAVNNAVTNTVRHYNIPADRIFADFVGQNDAEAAEAAQNIVRGLKRSFVETAALRTQNPTADWAFVTYFKFSDRDADGLYPDAWYRETDYKVGNFGYFELVKVSEDLDTDLRTIIKYERDFDQLPVGDATLGLQRIREYESRGGDASPYTCNDFEEASFQQGASEYLLANRYSVSGCSSLNSCAFESFANSTDSRTIAVRDFDGSGGESGAVFKFYPGDVINGQAALTGWYDMLSVARGLDEQDLLLATDDLVDTIRGLPYQFCNKGTAGALIVERSKVEVFDDRRVVTTRYADDSFDVRTEFNDGTSSTESLRLVATRLEMDAISLIVITTRLMTHWMISRSTHRRH